MKVYQKVFSNTKEEEDERGEEAIALIIGRGDYRALGKKYEELGQLNKALWAYEKGYLFDLAALVAQKQGKAGKASKLFMLSQRVIHYHSIN